jgi:hypothetical protein
MTDRIPRWLLAAKALLAALLLTGALLPSVGGFEGKGMAFRLPLFLAPACIVPLMWWRRRGRYPAALDAAFTLPFLFDTLGNAVGAYDTIDATDDVLHFVNWVVLVGGITWHLAQRHTGHDTRRLLWLAGAGLGAALIIGWEVAEYGVMELGVGGLNLTYGDTLADLVLSTAGGALGAWYAVRRNVHAAGA